MKQIPLLQGKALLVELPEGHKYYRVHNYIKTPGKSTLIHSNEGRAFFDSLPPGNWRIIGMLSEVTEKDVKPLVKYISDWGYINHGVKTQVREMLLKTALESLESAIFAEGYYLDENPHGDEPKPENTPNYAYSVDVRIWESSQSRVLDRSRCLLLGREGE